MNWKKPVFLLVLAFLLTAAWFWYEPAEASEMSISVGPTVVSGKTSGGFSLVFEETWSRKYRAAIGYVSPQACRCSEGRVDIKENAYVYLGRLANRGRFELSLGALYQVEANRVTSSRLNFKLGLRWYFGRRFAGGLSHVSNAGAAGDKLTNGFNTGQDTIPEVTFILNPGK